MINLKSYTMKYMKQSTHRKKSLRHNFLLLFCSKIRNFLSVPAGFLVIVCQCTTTNEKMKTHTITYQCWLSVHIYHHDQPSLVLFTIAPVLKGAHRLVRAMSWFNLQHSMFERRMEKNEKNNENKDGGRKLDWKEENSRRIRTEKRVSLKLYCKNMKPESFQIWQNEFSK